MLLAWRVVHAVQKLADKYFYDEDLSLISFTRKNDERRLLFRIEFFPEDGFKLEAFPCGELVVDESSKDSVLRYVTEFNRALCGTARLDFDLDRRVVVAVSYVSFGISNDGRFNFDMAAFEPILNETAFLATVVSESLKAMSSDKTPNA